MHFELVYYHFSQEKNGSFFLVYDIAFPSFIDVIIYLKLQTDAHVICVKLRCCITGEMFVAVIFTHKTTLNVLHIKQHYINIVFLYINLHTKQHINM